MKIMEYFLLIKYQCIGQWEKRDMVNDELYLINSNDVQDNLDDMSDEEPEEPGSNRN
ncbi:hypothetical protein DSM106972_016290 [Dulcicalothrix desertica PCC 7102]|uniref:Uncharacterized protein n=1 Tax=Dulcicalothrix desertica PCC 7102 TaxID=232991 RepID=A0A3S1CQE5_9CYAN|nr:hypothetical protein DSM106972_016290 [Dulcicalothrix desertica PCC 7102]